MTDSTDFDWILDDPDSPHMRAGAILFHGAVLDAFAAENRADAPCEEILIGLWWYLTLHMHTTRRLGPQDLHALIERSLRPVSGVKPKPKVEAGPEPCSAVNIAQFKPKKPKRRPN